MSILLICLYLLTFTADPINRIALYAYFKLFWHLNLHLQWEWKIWGMHRRLKDHFKWAIWMFVRINLGILVWCPTYSFEATKKELEEDKNTESPNTETGSVQLEGDIDDIDGQFMFQWLLQTLITNFREWYTFIKYYVHLYTITSIFYTLKFNWKQLRFCNIFFSIFQIIENGCQKRSWLHLKSCPDIEIGFSDFKW